MFKKLIVPNNTAKSNSLRATSASHLFSYNVPEKLIQEKTGHRSLAGLCAYECTTTKQEQAITKILSSSTKFIEDSEIENIDPVATLPLNSKADHTHKSTKSTSSAVPVFSGTLRSVIKPNYECDY